MKFPIVRYVLGGTALSLLLAGCAGMVPPTTTDRVPAQPTALARPFHHVIDLGGRLSMRYQGERKEESLHGGFAWSQTPAQTTLTLTSPLGQTMAIIHVTPQGAKLMQDGQPVRHAANVDTLTSDALGWPLPVSGLSDWLQGFALDAAGRRFVATPQASAVTTHDGWHIHYVNWQGDSRSQYHPRRIDLARATEHGGDVFIRIVIDSWQAH